MSNYASSATPPLGGAPSASSATPPPGGAAIPARLRCRRRRDLPLLMLRDRGHHLLLVLLDRGRRPRLLEVVVAQAVDQGPVAIDGRVAEISGALHADDQFVVRNDDDGLGHGRVLLRS